MSYPLKSDWLRPSACNISRIDFLKNYGYANDISIVSWPKSIIEYCDFAEKIGTYPVLFEFKRFLNQGIISMTRLVDSCKTSMTVKSCIVLLGETFEPVFLRKINGLSVYCMRTRFEHQITDFEYLKEAITTLTEPIFDPTPALIMEAQIVQD